MKQTSRKLLRELCEKNTKAALVSFWTDLKSLRKSAFIDELDGILSKKAVRATPVKLKSVKPDRNFLMIALSRALRLSFRKRKSFRRPRRSVCWFRR